MELSRRLLLAAAFRLFWPSLWPHYTDVFFNSCMVLMLSSHSLQLL